MNKKYLLFFVVAFCLTAHAMEKENAQEHKKHSHFGHLGDALKHIGTRKRHITEEKPFGKENDQRKNVETIKELKEIVALKTSPRKHDSHP